MRILLAALLLVMAAIVALELWRRTDERRAEAAWKLLAASVADLPERFDPALVAELPEPARRYFTFTIGEGAILSHVVEIDMTGELSLGSKEEPGYQPMEARQVLAAPHGLVWRLEAGRGLMRIVGSDGMEGGESWTRFWLLGLAPVVRLGGGADHLRSAFGRVVAEAAFWSPAALLPQNGVTWEAVDDDTARATVTHMGMTQTVEIRVDGEGRPEWVRIPRWSDANPDQTYRIQPFGGTLADFREVDGYRLPFEVDGGNFFGTDDYFPFYKARVQAIRVGEG